MLDAATQAALSRRLDRIEARVHRLTRSVKGPATCPALLREIAATEEALFAVSVAIVKHHANSCVRQEADSATRLQAGLSELIDIFDRFFR